MEGGLEAGIVGLLRADPDGQLKQSKRNQDDRASSFQLLPTPQLISFFPLLHTQFAYYTLSLPSSPSSQAKKASFDASAGMSRSYCFVFVDVGVCEVRKESRHDLLRNAARTFWKWRPTIDLFVWQRCCVWMRVSGQADRPRSAHHIA